MERILEAILAGADGPELAALPVPESYRAAFVRREDVGMFDGLASADKDPTKSLHVDDVPTPALAPDEVYLAVMASSINFNTVWTSIFEPAAHVRLPRPPREGERVGRPPRPPLPGGGVGRVRRRPPGRLRGPALEARATG